MINEKKAREYCCEDISLIRGYERAVNDNTQMYVIHHLEGVFYTREELMEAGRYYDCPAESLLFMTRDEHIRYHQAFRPPMSDKTKKKISDSKKGWVPSEETRKNISEAKKGKYAGERAYWYGKQRSEEDRMKISDKLKGVPNLVLSVRILQFTLDGELIKEHTSIRSAQTAVGRPAQSHICACCKGKLKSAYGYIWRSAE